jgi:peptide/nickel transport system substrate-binding protein
VPGQVSPVKGLVTVTPAGTKAVPSVVWRVYRNVDSLDPAFSIDFPEYTAVSLMCESLLRQAPDGSLQPGLATVAHPNPTTIVFTLQPGVKFWDGHPVTAADVVYSLDRNTDPKLGGFYRAVFDRVASIAATGPSQVTVRLKQPDYWLEGELSSMPGVIIEKSFAQKEGKTYGTPAGSIMCTGAYKLQFWTSGEDVVAVRNPRYWNPTVRPLVDKITVEGVPSITDFTSGLLTGAIRGGYVFAALPTLDRLKASSAVRVYEGPSLVTGALVVSSLKGVLGDLRVRRALSLALNREAIINSVYEGAALMPRWLSNPGTFGYGKPVFAAAYSSSPVLAHNVAEAKKLVKQAGATGKTITFGTSSQIAAAAELTGAYQEAAETIGLKVVLRSVSAQNYVNFFTSPQARAGVDGFPTASNGDYADPAGLLAEIVLPGGLMNFDNFSDPKIAADLEKARATANPDKRAALVAQAEKLTIQQLPWIPDVEPVSLLLLGKGLSGAVASFAAMFSPWADKLGGTG